MSVALPASSRPLGAPLRATDDLEIDEGELWDDGDMPQASADQGADPVSVTTTGTRSSQNALPSVPDGAAAAHRASHPRHEDCAACSAGGPVARLAATNGIAASPQLTPHVSSSSDDDGMVRTLVAVAPVIQSYRDVPSRQQPPAAHPTAQPMAAEVAPLP